MDEPVFRLVHYVEDGFGNEWECRHELPFDYCCLEVVRPGKVQCVCDAGLAALIDHHKHATASTRGER